MSPQPSTPQYPLSALNLFQVYASRAAYLQATGKQAPPFDASRAPQYWEDPSQAGKPQGAMTPSYLVVDTSHPETGFLNQISLRCAWAASVNLPGVYSYPAYVSPPTDAVEVGPFGPVGAASANEVCLQADAQAMADELAPLFPGKTLTVVPQTPGVYYFVYGKDPRRIWYIAVGSPAIQAFIAQALIEAQNSHGVGYPGSFQMVSGQAQWIADTPVTQPPPGAVNVPTPIRQLLPNEVIAHVAGSNPLFDQAGQWVVQRSDIAQPAAPETNDQQFADIKALLQQLLAGQRQQGAALKPSA